MAGSPLKTGLKLARLALDIDTTHVTMQRARRCDVSFGRDRHVVDARELFDGVGCALVAHAQPLRGDIEPPDPGHLAGARVGNRDQQPAQRGVGADSQHFEKPTSELSPRVGCEAIEAAVAAIFGEIEPTLVGIDSHGFVVEAAESRQRECRRVAPPAQLRRVFPQIGYASTTRPARSKRSADTPPPKVSSALAT
jgi:hypothetical protein